MARLRVLSRRDRHGRIRVRAPEWDQGEVMRGKAGRRRLSSPSGPGLVPCLLAETQNAALEAGHGERVRCTL